MTTPPPPYRVIVTGSRDTTDAEDAFVWGKLDQLRAWLPAGRLLIVVQGVCPYGGVDKAAERWTRRVDGAENEGHPADFRQGASAGPKRNTKMVQLGAHLVMAFPGPYSRGTWDCLQKAVNAGIPPRLYPLHIYCPAEEATPR
jgi:hypothetical protein